MASSDDLPAEVPTDPLVLADPSPLSVLAEVLGSDHKVRPLRDATCRSFPVWDLGADTTRRLGELDDAALEVAAQRWQEKSGARLDADLYELTTHITELRQAILEGEPGDRLFALLEERAF